MVMFMCDVSGSEQAVTSFFFDYSPFWPLLRRRSQKMSLQLPPQSCYLKLLNVALSSEFRGMTSNFLTASQ